jgi:hypothetical protein
VPVGRRERPAGKIKGQPHESQELRPCGEYDIMLLGQVLSLPCLSFFTDFELCGASRATKRPVRSTNF